MGKKYNKRIEALEMAIGLLEDKKESYICYALGRVSVERPHLKKVCRILTEYIQESLIGFAFLEMWQGARGLVKTKDEMRQDRIDWCQWIIDQYDTSSRSFRFPREGPPD